VLAGSDHGVQLRQHDGALGDRPELAPYQFVDEVAHVVVVLLLALGLLDVQLQLALDPAHEEVVDHDVVSRVVQLVLDAHQLEEPPHLGAVVEVVHGVEQADEAALRALQFRPQQVAHPERHQVYVVPTFICRYFLSCPEEVVDEGVDVLEHEGSEYGVDLGRHRPGLRVTVHAGDELTATFGAQQVGNRTVACPQYIPELLLHFLVLLFQLFYQPALSILDILIFLQIDEVVFNVAEGVEAPADVLLGGLEDFLQVLRPLREDAEHGGVAGRELLAGDFLLAEGLDKGGDLLV
jgi:hypothetical protein